MTGSRRSDLMPTTDRPHRQVLHPPDTLKWILFTYQTTIYDTCSFRLFYSSMSSSLSSMSSSCLQSRADPGGYPYMFHDPLHSLSSTYQHQARAAAAACGPAVAHAQSAVNTHPAAYGASTPTSAPGSTGKKLMTPYDHGGEINRLYEFRICVTYNQNLLGKSIFPPDFSF